MMSICAQIERHALRVLVVACCICALWLRARKQIPTLTPCTQHIQGSGERQIDLMRAIVGGVPRSPCRAGVMPRVKNGVPMYTWYVCITGDHS